MRARLIIWFIAVIIMLTAAVADEIDYFTDRMNFPPGESKIHTITVTNNKNTAVTVNITVPSGFSAAGIGSCSYPVSGIYTCSLLPNTSKYAEIYSPGSCAEGSIYYSQLTGGGNFSERLVFVCIPDSKIVDSKIEYGHGCSNYLTESCISTETATIFNLLRVWNIGNYLDPDEDAINAVITCYYENYPVRTYGRTEINYTPGITGDFLWSTIEGGYWFRIGVVSQDVSGKIPGDIYSVNCTGLAYQFEHEQVIAEFQNYSLNVVSPNPFTVTSQNYTADPSKYIYTIKNNQSCSVYNIYFTRSIDGYTKTEHIPKLGPGQQVNYIGDNANASNITIQYLPSWQANSLCPTLYTQTSTVTGMINNPPIITSANPSGNATINESQIQQFSITYTDADSDILTIRWYINSSLVKTETDIPPYGTSYYNFTNATPGTYNLQAMVFDSYSSDSYIWVITVNQSVLCGNTVCDPGESCSTCPTDCGVCPPSCGNGICDGGESCSTCPTDCGSCGGGGGRCITNLICEEWQPQQCPETAIQTRYCYDKNKCTKKTYTESRSCLYILPCLNGVQDNGETGIDCGGDCQSCTSCFNKIKDDNEEGIDCGGDCPPCATCYDGIKNTHILENGTILKEQGIDCGEPCQPCPCEEECAQERVPGEICKDIMPSWIILIIVLALFLFCSLVSYNYTFIKDSIIKRKKTHNKIDLIERLIVKTKRLGNDWKTTLLGAILLILAIFILPLIDKGCYECRIISSRLLLTLFLAVIIIKLVIKLFSLTFKNNLIVITLRGYKHKIIQKLVHKRFCSYYCRKIFWILLLLALIIVLYLTYANCPAASCDDLIRNQAEIGVDCGGYCPDCSVIERPAELCGIPPWEILIIILLAVFLAYFIDYIIYLISRRKNKEFILYEYIKNSGVINAAAALFLLLVMFSTLILDRQCFECREIKSAYLLILTVFLVIIFMIYRLYSKAKGLHILNLCKYKGIRLIILLFVIIIISATLLELYAYCPRSTCSDGIQNQMEKGIDCGGPCSPCLMSYINPYLIMLLLVLLLLFLALYGAEVYYKYDRLKKIYNIELCPRCGTHMHRKGWLKAGIGRGKRTVYLCPRCKYKTIRNEQEINLKERICPDCEIEMTSKNIRMFGRTMGKMYTCPHCGQRRIRMKFFD
jgi:hypothetical protein